MGETRVSYRAHKSMGISLVTETFLVQVRQLLMSREPTHPHPQEVTEAATELISLSNAHGETAIKSLHYGV